MLSIGEMVLLGAAAVFFLGRKEGARLLKNSSNTVNKFWKEMSKKEMTSGASKTSKKTSKSEKVSQTKEKD